jgi:hypothetical protein
MINFWIKLSLFSLLLFMASDLLSCLMLRLIPGKTNNTIDILYCRHSVPQNLYPAIVDDYLQNYTDIKLYYLR